MLSFVFNSSFPHLARDHSLLSVWLITHVPHLVFLLNNVERFPVQWEHWWSSSLSVRLWCSERWMVPSELKHSLQNCRHFISNLHTFISSATSPVYTSALPLSFLTDVVESGGTAGSCGAVYSSISLLSSLFFPCPCICIKVVTDEDPIVYSYIHRLEKRNTFETGSRLKYPAHPAAMQVVIIVIL